jgi:hypothetical protein
MSRILALIGIVLLEVPAVSVALPGDDTNAGLLAFAAVHAGISLAAAVLGWWVLPSHLRVPAPQVGAFLLAVCLFVPVFGPALVALIVTATAWFRGQIVHEEVDHLSGHAGRMAEKGDQPISTVSGAMARLTATDTSSKIRVDALLKLQTIKSEGSASVMRSALLDEAEEVRLIAFGILDIKEKSVSKQIRVEHERWKAATSDLQRIFHARQLAWLYAELADQGLVEGEVLRHALEQIGHYAESVLAVNPGEGGMWLLKGRIQARAGNLDAARDAFMQALALGLPEAQCIPYLAELEFNRRRFAEVRRLLLSVQAIKDLPDVGRVVRFWSEQSREAA